jgi:hypothetical protein
MSNEKPLTPRDAYQAYLKGDLTPAQAEQAVQSWYTAAQQPTPKPPERD